MLLITHQSPASGLRCWWSSTTSAAGATYGVVCHNPRGENRASWSKRAVARSPLHLLRPVQPWRATAPSPTCWSRTSAQRPKPWCSSVSSRRRALRVAVGYTTSKCREATSLFPVGPTASITASRAAACPVDGLVRRPPLRARASVPRGRDQPAERDRPRWPGRSRARPIWGPADWARPAERGFVRREGVRPAEGGFARQREGSATWARRAERGVGPAERGFFGREGVRPAEEKVRPAERGPADLCPAGRGGGLSAERGSVRGRRPGPAEQGLGRPRGGWPKRPGRRNAAPGGRKRPGGVGPAELRPGGSPARSGVMSTGRSSLWARAGRQPCRSRVMSRLASSGGSECPRRRVCPTRVSVVHMMP